MRWSEKIDAMLKIGVVGIGTVAVDNYLPSLARQSDVQLACFNRSPERAKAAAGRFGGDALSSLEEMAEWRPDSVLVLTSETVRYEVGSRLIELGVPRLFFEKPLVAELGQAHVSEADFSRGRQMLEAAEARSCETAMVFNYRFFEHTILAHNIVGERDFGELIGAVGLVHFACWSHCIDLIHYFGGRVSDVTAMPGHATRVCPEVNIEATDRAVALSLENGGTATLLGTAGMQWEYPLFELTLTFERGRLHMRDLDGDLEILDGRRQDHEVYSLVRSTSRWAQYSSSFDKSLTAYLETLRRGVPPPVPGIEGLRELQLEAAMVRSIAKSRSVRVQDEFPLHS
jgi:predicted dehydrogenase